MASSPTDVTLLLKQITDGDQDAVATLVPLLYKELRSLAGYYLRRERSDHTLQATALVHEAYLRLIDQREVDWKNRSHFMGVAAQVMRRILMDHARSHLAVKRGGLVSRISLEAVADSLQDKAPDLVVLDELLTRLSRLDPQQGRVVELRFFGGLSVEETADFLGISPATVKRDWAMAKAWLAKELKTKNSSRSERIDNELV